MSQPDRDGPRRTLRWSPTLGAYVRPDYPATPPPDEWVVELGEKESDLDKSRESFPSDEDAAIKAITRVLSESPWFSDGEPHDLVPLARAVLDAVSSHRDDEAREPCPDCDGSGSTRTGPSCVPEGCACEWETCATCDGTGKVSAEKRAYARAVSDVVEELDRVGAYIPHGRMLEAGRHVVKWAADRKAGT